MCVRVCVCERERERDGVGVRKCARVRETLRMGLCVREKEWVYVLYV